VALAAGVVVLLVFFSSPPPAFADTGYEAWLRYARIADPTIRTQYASLPDTVIVLGDTPVVRSAHNELQRGLASMLDLHLRAGGTISAAPSIVLGERDLIRRALPAVTIPELPRPESFWIGFVTVKHPVLVIAGRGERGVLYGTFALLQRIALGEPILALSVRGEPAASVRWVNEWNNLDGSIERGYAGRSIFFDDNRVVDDLTRARDYARLLASVGINACAVNNVNADARAITDEFLPQLVRLASAFRPWGVRLALAIDFSSPKTIGGLDTFDPLDARVGAFWRARVDAIYRAIPDFAGFVLKADSEGRLGPSAYGRTHADAANVIAQALAPHGGVLFYRGFVYDHRADWRDLKNDRARAAFENFKPLDGRFDPNVVLQIKYGPIDFQVREPPSPLFGALHHTNEAIELQITQEYVGQQRHVCFLVPMWKEVLDFDMERRNSTPVPVKAFVTGAAYGRPIGGFVAVSNVGRVSNWLGHDLAMANLYGFGRLAWNPDATSQQLAEEWTILTFGRDRRVVSAISGILLDSWRTYERYTGSLGMGGLTDILGSHYGPGIESSEHNGWGQWHRANGRGVGMDRTLATGTGFIGQYDASVAERFESLATMPDELLLFFHHVPFTHVLHSGKTVIQHIYDAHYDGAREAAKFVERWRTIERLIDDERYVSVLTKLEYQAGHALVWRDAVTSWFAWISDIPDDHGRVGHYPNRIEAESTHLERYLIVPVTPWETASAGQAVRCPTHDRCAMTFRFDRERGNYDVAVQYFDQAEGASRFRLLVAGRQIDQWVADGDYPSVTLNGDTSTRHVTRAVAIAPGDTIRVEAVTDREEDAAIDYVEINPSSGVAQ
jgi:alpha-glucuronidase